MNRVYSNRLFALIFLISFVFLKGCVDDEEEPSAIETNSNRTNTNSNSNPNNNTDPCQTMSMRTVNCIASHPEDGDVVSPQEIVLNFLATTPNPSYTIYLGTDENNLAIIATQTSNTYTFKNLEFNKTYYWKVSAVNYCGFGCSTGVKRFSTVANLELPFVITLSPVNHLYSPPRLGGNVKFKGSSEISDRGVYVSLSPVAEMTGTKYQVEKGIGLFSDLIPELLPNTIYYSRSYATNQSGTTYGNEVTFNTAGKTDYASVTDVEGNIYYTLKIGNQIWMSENLRTTRFNDGTEIPQITENSKWQSATSPAYCWYDNDAGLKTTYGALYNWYTVDSSSNGGKNICPTGWHVPKSGEFSALLMSLGGESNSGISLRESGNEFWVEFTSVTSSNSSGFCALPAGLRFGDPTTPPSYDQFYYIGMIAFWWSSSSANLRTPYHLETGFNQTGAFIYYVHTKGTGLSIRCIKDVN